MSVDICLKLTILFKKTYLKMNLYKKHLSCMYVYGTYVYVYKKRT